MGTSRMERKLLGPSRNLYFYCSSSYIKKHGEEPVGIIKIENHRLSDSIKQFNEFNNSRIYCFTDRHNEILTILADSIVIAIQNLENLELTSSHLHFY